MRNIESRVIIAVTSLINELSTNHSSRTNAIQMIKDAEIVFRREGILSLFLYLVTGSEPKKQLTLPLAGALYTLAFPDNETEKIEVLAKWEELVFLPLASLLEQPDHMLELATKYQRFFALCQATFPAIEREQDGEFDHIDEKE